MTSGRRMPRPLARLWTVAIDPGVWRCGLAVFDGPRLVYASEPTDHDRTGHVGRLLVVEAEAITRGSGRNVRYVAETPQDYKGKSARVGTLEELRWVLSTINASRGLTGPPMASVRPSAWKGQVPKHIHHERIRGVLSDSEIAVVDELGRDRDALDAIGIGLWYLGRVGRGGTRLDPRVGRN